MVGSRSIGYFLTHVVNNFSNEKATVNVIDFSNVKSSKLTLYTDLLSSKKEGDLWFWFEVTVCL